MAELLRAPADTHGGIAILRGSIVCPIEALAAWCNMAGTTTGPLFRSIRKGGKVSDR